VVFRNLQQLSILLKRERERAGLTVRQLANAAELTASTVSRLETGLIASPKPDQLQRLAGVLGIEVEELYAVAGYLVPEGLPALRPYLRAKYGLSDELANRIEGYIEGRVEALQEATQTRRREGQSDYARDEAP
jgi:transcriptional regulator with XRE-family HTH domain